jgi:hypothetical protein
VRRAANEETATTVAERSVNPLWMITAALSLFFAAMAVFV